MNGIDKLMKRIIIFTMVCVLQSSDLNNLSFGTDSSLDIATWNIEWFPKNGYVTTDYVTQVIENLELDLLAIQEISDTLMFDQMVDALDDYTGYYQSAWFAGLGYIYNNQTVQVNSIYEIYTTSPYWSPFPRSPMVMDFDFEGENYIVINNHFKCCGDGNLNQSDTGDEETRRQIASNLLKEYIDAYLQDKNVIVLGDLNDDIAESGSNNVFQQIIDDTQNYLFADMAIAQGPSSGWSFPNWPSHLDHILITNELFDIYYSEGSASETIKVDDYMSGGFSSYDYNISDHRPVALRLYTGGPVIDGDINSDGVTDIIDIIQLVGVILDSGYSSESDINDDGAVDIIDVVALIDIVLSSDREQ